MSAAVSVFVIDAEEQAASALRQVIAGAGLRLAGSRPNAQAALDAVRTSPPDVVVLDASACLDLIGTVRAFVAAAPHAVVIVTGADIPSVLMSRAVAAGARGFLVKPYVARDLLDLVDDAVRSARGAMHVTPDPARKEHVRGKVLAVYSPKGGVGCTTVATNLAVALSARENTSVALIDLDLQFGDVGAALDLHTVNTIAELLKTDTVTPELVADTFVRHESGVRVLLAPDDVNAVEHIEIESVLRMLEALRPQFDFIVCDLWSSLDPLTRGVMKLADSVLFVTTPEFPALRDLQRVINSSRAELHLDGRMSVVLNRFPGKVGLPMSDVSKALGHPITATIPSEGITVTDAINRGLSLLDSRAKVRSARSYHTLANLTAAAATPAASPGAGHIASMGVAR